MSPTQQRALDAYEARVAMRRRLEIAQCEQVVAGHYDRESRTNLGLARIHEEVARVQAMQLGAMGTAPATPIVCDCGTTLLPVGAISVICDGDVEHSETACIGCVA